MKQFFVKTMLLLVLIASSYVTFSKESPYQATAIVPENNTTNSNQSSVFTTCSNQTTFPHQSQTTYSQEQLNNMATLAYLKCVMGEEKFAQFMQQCHINAYGYSADYLNNIIKDYSFEELQRVLIKDKNLTQAQALNTWDWFCNPKWCQGKKKSAGRACIIQEYNQREQTKINQQKEKQAQQKKVALEQQRSTLRLNTKRIRRKNPYGVWI